MDKSPEAFRTISEVAEALDVPPHVLRFWETRFAQVKPVKRGGGRRYYRPEDVRLLRGIRGLLYDDGMTIKGVQKILRERGDPPRDRPRHRARGGGRAGPVSARRSAPAPRPKPRRGRSATAAATVAARATLLRPAAATAAADGHRPPLERPGSAAARQVGPARAPRRARGAARGDDRRCPGAEPPCQPARRAFPLALAGGRGYKAPRVGL